MHTNAKQRLELLKHLYQARQADPRHGWVKVFELRNALGEVDFALEVLREIGHIQGDDARYRITGQGVLAHESTHI